MVIVPTLEVWGWLYSQPGQLAFVVFWDVSFSTLYISDWCPAFSPTLLVLLEPQLWGNITVIYELSCTFEAPSWLILVWESAPNLHCSSVRNGFLNRSWNLQGTAPLHLIVFIFVHKSTENGATQKEFEGLCLRDCAERGKVSTDEVWPMPCSIPESYLCPVQPGNPCVVPSARAGMTVHMCTAQQGWIKFGFIIFRGFYSPCLASKNVWEFGQ